MFIVLLADANALPIGLIPPKLRDYAFVFRSLAESAAEKLCELVFVDITFLVGNDIGHA